MSKRGQDISELRSKAEAIVNMSTGGDGSLVSIWWVRTLLGLLDRLEMAEADAKRWHNSQVHTEHVIRTDGLPPKPRAVPRNPAPEVELRTLGPSPGHPRWRAPWYR